MKIPNSPFSTRLSGSTKETELRIRNIFQWKKQRPPVIALVTAVLVVVFCGSLIAFVPNYELVPDGIEVLAAMGFSDSLIYASEENGTHFDLHWVKEGQEPDLLCRFGHWGYPSVKLKKMKLGEHTYLLVQHNSHYPDVPFLAYKEFTNIFYLPEGDAPIYTLQIEGDFHLKDITGDGVKEIVCNNRNRNRRYMAVSDGQLLGIDEYGNLVPDEILEENLERLYRGKFTTGVNYAAPLVRKFEGIVLEIDEDSLSVLAP